MVERLERLRLLSGVGMRRARVDLELLQHLPPEGALRQHALHRQAQDPLGVALHEAGQVLRPEPARVLRVPVVPLVGALLGVDGDLRGVDHDDEIARVDMRGVNRLVLAPQNAGDFAGQAAHNLVGGVDQQPLLLDSASFGHVGGHGTDTFSNNVSKTVDGAVGVPKNRLRRHWRIAQFISVRAGGQVTIFGGRGWRREAGGQGICLWEESRERQRPEGGVVKSLQIRLRALTLPAWG